MKKFLNSLFGVLLVIGIIAAGAVASDAMVALKGDTVSLNESVKSDFEKKAMINGEVFYVYDQIAVEEVTHTTYGIKTGTDETYFYLIDTYDKDWFDSYSDNYDPLTVIYSTADKDKAAELDKMVDAWCDYEEAYYDWYYDEDATEEDFPEPPTATFELSGIISKYNDDKLIEYRDEYLGNYVTDDVDAYVDQYCVDMIIEDVDPSSSKGIFFVGIGVGVIGLVGLIVSLISSKKAKKSEELL